MRVYLQKWNAFFEEKAFGNRITDVKEESFHGG